MRVLVATREGQGLRSSDVCLADEGEILSWGYFCCPECGPVDGKCPCLRSMVGVRSGMPTTTFRVVERGELESKDLVAMLVAAAAREGRAWSGAERAAAADAKELERLAAHLPAGAVLEVREAFKVQVREGVCHGT